MKHGVNTDGGHDGNESLDEGSSLLGDSITLPPAQQNDRRRPCPVGVPSVATECFRLTGQEPVCQVPAVSGSTMDVGHQASGFTPGCANLNPANWASPDWVCEKTRSLRVGISVETGSFYFLIPRRCSSNQSAKMARSFSMPGQPWSLPSRTINLNGTFISTHFFSNSWAW